MTADPPTGERAQLRPVARADIGRLTEIRQSPTVVRWWGSPETESWPFDDQQAQVRAIWVDGELEGSVQWYDNNEPRYRHAGIDLFLSPEVQGRGLGREVVALVVGHLISQGHHRIVIDPAVSNLRAIACYEACGFVPVGVMRRYERDNDGEGWHDGLLMEYVVEPDQT